MAGNVTSRLSIHLRRRSHVVMWSSALLFVALAAISVITGVANWVITGFLPLAVALVTSICGAKAFSADLTSSGLSIHGAPNEIPYENMTSVTIDWSVSDRRSNGPWLLVEHTGGRVWIPSPLNVPTETVLETLKAHGVPDPPPPAIAEALQPYVAEQRFAFGDDRVHVFGRRRATAPDYDRRCLTGWTIACFGLSAAWMAAATAHPPGGDLSVWWGPCVLSFFTGLLLLLILFVTRRSGRRAVDKYRDATLVVSPGGFAMAQGDLQGKLPWEGILGMDYRRRARSGELANFGRHIAVSVPGSRIVILDLYDHDLEQIAASMRRYWKPPT